MVSTVEHKGLSPRHSGIVRVYKHQVHGRKPTVDAWAMYSKSTVECLQWKMAGCLSSW